MRDTLGREISYLRLSVTDRCDLRCRYCMPEHGVEQKQHSQILSYEEMLTVVKECAKFGIRKIRITGGEPLVRKGVIDFISQLKKIEGINEINLTTNGIKLAKYAVQLKEAGVDSINISLDSLREDRFGYITRCGNLTDVLMGIQNALEVGFERIKVNVVAMKGFNDDEIMDFVDLAKDNPIYVRFIELMSIGQAVFLKDKYISSDDIRKRIPHPLKEVENRLGTGPAEYYSIDGYKGLIGFIDPVSNCFCTKCNRIRLTADGKLIPCLHSEKEVDLRPVIAQKDLEKLDAAIRKTIELKPERHNLGGEFNMATESNKDGEVSPVGIDSRKASERSKKAKEKAASGNDETGSGRYMSQVGG